MAGIARTDKLHDERTGNRDETTEPSPPMKHPVFFNAHHSPCGAFASFTCGSKGPRGGLGMELAGPADEQVFVGIEDRDHPGKYLALPFIADADGSPDQSGDYDVEGLSGYHRKPAVRLFPDSEISRKCGASVDEWKAGDLTFRIVSPVRPLPDPESASADELRDALVPAVIAELTIDNRDCQRARKVFFGYAGSDRSSAMRVIREPGLVGVAQGMSTAIATADRDVWGGIGWQPEAVLDPRRPSNLESMLGNLGLLVASVAAGELRTFRFAICFFKEGTVTTGIPSRYLYRRWFERIEDVARHALETAGGAVPRALAFDERLGNSLSPERGLMLVQALRSYYGATQCLELEDGRVFWVVNEGEYRMMNTFDLTVDQSFFELALNPWTVRNELDFFVDRYAYEDQTRFPNDSHLYPGGITFTHDMGVANALAEPGRSSYEQAGLHGCFSYMSCEELVNWILTASLYLAHTKDEAWLQRRSGTIRATLRSLMNRDHPVPSERNGLMGLDSSRCEGGAEITTYDSLDASLGQARNNVYLAVKSWAAYVLLDPILRKLGFEADADAALEQASRCARTLVAAVEADGCLPAVIGEGVTARIIPAIEGLAYPYLTGQFSALDRNGLHGDLINALERHLDLVLKPGVCLFPSGAWKLSSSSNNSWLSKIYLCQFVAEKVFGREPDRNADRSHLGWLLSKENEYYAWSDQMLDGKAVGSRYYPRGVTSVLWLASDESCPIADVRSVFTN